MKQGKVDLRQAAMKTCLHAAAILTSILAGAVAAHDAAENERRATEPGNQMREAAGSAPAADRAGAVVLDAEALRAVARFGQSAAGLESSQAALRQLQPGELSSVQVVSGDGPRH